MGEDEIDETRFIRRYLFWIPPIVTRKDALFDLDKDHEEISHESLSHNGEKYHYTN